MSEQTVYDYVMKVVNAKNDFEMLHQYALDKIRSCNFGPKYEHDLYDDDIKSLANIRAEYAPRFAFDVKSFDDHTDYIPLSGYEYMYNNIEYPKIIHKYLRDKNFTDKDFIYSVLKLNGYNEHSHLRIDVKLTYSDKSLEIDNVCHSTHIWKYIPYKYCIKFDSSRYGYLYELIDFFPQYVKPKHTKQDYINYFITNDFNCNRLRKLIIELSKIMLTRREEDITKHIKRDEILDDLQLLINYAQQLIIDCKEYLDKQTNDATVKLAF